MREVWVEDPRPKPGAVSTGLSFAGLSPTGPRLVHCKHRDRSSSRDRKFVARKIAAVDEPSTAARVGSFGLVVQWDAKGKTNALEPAALRAVVGDGLVELVNRLA